MMRSHSQNIFIQIDEAGLRKEKIEILESFCQPEALHLIGSGRVQVADIVDASVCMFRHPASCSVLFPVIRYRMNIDSTASGLFSTSAI
jgi:hypothetical protein